MKKIYLLLLIILICSKASATEQIPNNLVYKGNTYDWYGSSPAFTYFKDNNFKVPEEAIQTSANWSYYIMTYTIENNSLYLTDVEILINKESKFGKEAQPDIIEKTVFEHFFPSKNKVLMDFYSNIQQIPFGKMVEVTKKGWTDNHYKRYLIFDIKKGRILTSYRLSYKNLKKLKSKLFSGYIQTPEYQVAVINESENLKYFNEFRPNKYSMDMYLEYMILRLLNKLE